MRRSKFTGFGTTRSGYCERGRDGSVPSVDARARNESEFFPSTNSSGLRSDQFPMRNERRFSTRIVLSKIEQIDESDGLIMLSALDCTSLVERFNRGQRENTCHIWQMSWNTPQTYSGIERQNSREYRIKCLNKLCHGNNNKEKGTSQPHCTM